ncbi:hypothetical protein [Streptomyces sp. NPDC001978]|uniref:hypothetical protein n=1 Tax=Streptomyces sp. NPDC001978 TaxID=3364627 RepID=UPI00367509B7
MAGTTLPPDPANAWRSASAGRVRVGAFAREFFLQHVRRPLALAVRASDSDILGALSTPAGGLLLHQELGLYTLLGGMVDVWRTHGLVVTTVPTADHDRRGPDRLLLRRRRRAPGRGRLTGASSDLLERAITAVAEPPGLPPAAPCALPPGMSWPCWRTPGAR